MLIKIWFSNYHVTRRKDFHKLFFNCYLKEKFPQHTIFINRNDPDIVFCSVFQPSNVDEVVRTFPNAVKVFYTPENVYKTDRFRRVYGGAIKHKFDYFIDFNGSCPCKNAKHERIPFWYFDRDYYKRSDSTDLKLVEQMTKKRNVKLDDLGYASLVSRTNRSGYRTTVLSYLNSVSDDRKVTCPSDVGKNHPSIEEQGLDKVQFLSKYIFNVCLENTYHEGYVTEKIFDASLSGTIPIYWGGLEEESTIINMDKVICVDPTDVKSLDNLKDRVDELMTNPDKLSEMVNLPSFKEDAVSEINRYSDKLDEIMNDIISEVKTRYFMENVPTIRWINIERSAERREIMMRNFSKYRLKNERVIGFDGKNNNFPDWFIPNRKNEKLELCISISHFKAIKQFLSSSEDIGFIAEDDLSFDYARYWKEPLMSIVQRLPSDWEVFQMSVVLTTGSGYRKHIENPDQIIRRSKYQFGATAYLITRAGAEKLIELYERKEGDRTILDLSVPKTINKKIFRSDSENIVFGSLKSYCMRLPYFTYNDCDLNCSVHQNNDKETFMSCKEKFLEQWKR